MSQVKYYHVSDTGLAEGVSLGRITVVLASDFDNATRLFLDAAERCLAAERREKELQQRLADAERRNAALVAAAGKLREALVIAVGDKSPFAKCALSEVDAALTKPEEAKS
jgi:hypothetical protein